MSSIGAKLIRFAKKWGQGPMRLCLEFLAYAWAAKPDNKKSVRVLIFAQGRTGSTLLESLLCSSGHFNKNGEPLKESGANILFPTLYLKGLSKKHLRKNFICHVKLYHLTRDRKEAGRNPVSPATFLQILADSGWKIIYLRRENKLLHAISSFVAEERGSYKKTDDKIESFTVHIPRKRLEERMEARVIFEAEEKDALKGIHYHEVVYERDLLHESSHQRTSDDIFDYLSLEHRPVSTHLRKVNSRPIQKVVSNYEEFEKWVMEMGWESSLNHHSFR